MSDLRENEYKVMEFHNIIIALMVKNINSLQCAILASLHNIYIRPTSNGFHTSFNNVVYVEQVKN